MYFSKKFIFSWPGRFIQSVKVSIFLILGLQVQMMKTLEQQQQQKGVLQKQQQGDDTQLLRGTTNEVITKQSPGTTNALTKRVYENYPPAQRNPLSEANKVCET